MRAGRNPTLKSLMRQCVMPAIWWTDTCVADMCCLWRKRRRCCSLYASILPAIFCTAAESTAPTFRNRWKPPTTRRLKHLSLSATAKSISVSPHWTSRRNLSRAHITSECATKWIWEATDERDTSDY